MVLDGILGYVAGTVTKYAKDAAEGIIKKTTKGLTGGIGEKHDMPEAVAKSVGADYDHKKYKPAYAGYAVLFAPLVIGGALIAWLKTTETSAANLSPPSLNILLVIVFILTTLYALFLIFAFIGKYLDKSKTKS